MEIQKTRSNGLLWGRLTNGNELTNIIGTYLVTDGGIVDRRDVHNLLAEAELEIILATVQGERTMVLGDMNARIGEKPSVLVDVEEELQVRLQKHARVYERRSQDTTATVQGKRILELLSSGGIVVTNGLAQEMEFTFIAKGRTATSVPDIIGVSESMFRTGMTTRVITNLDIDSDHKMIFVEIPTEQALLQQPETTTTTQTASSTNSWKTPRENDSELWQELFYRSEQEMREYNEEMEDYIEEWRENEKHRPEVDEDFELDGHAWERYKFRTNEVLNEVFGKKKQGRKRKCQGKYYEFFLLGYLYYFILFDNFKYFKLNFPRSAFQMNPLDF